MKFDDYGGNDHRKTEFEVWRDPDLNLKSGSMFLIKYIKFLIKDVRIFCDVRKKYAWAMKQISQHF